MTSSYVTLSTIETSYLSTPSYAPRISWDTLKNPSPYSDDQVHLLVFNSHDKFKSTSKCNWSSEYGDGFFMVSHDILGAYEGVDRNSVNRCLQEYSVNGDINFKKCIILRVHWDEQCVMRR